MDITDSIDEHIEDLERFRWCDEIERQARMICRPAFYSTRQERHLAITTTKIELRIEEFQRRRW
jgi:hypothetical protein